MVALLIKVSGAFKADDKSGVRIFNQYEFKKYNFVISFRSRV